MMNCSEPAGVTGGTTKMYDHAGFMLDDPESTPDHAMDTAATPLSSVTTALIVGVPPF